MCEISLFSRVKIWILWRQGKQRNFQWSVIVEAMLSAQCLRQSSWRSSLSPSWLGFTENITTGVKSVSHQLFFSSITIWFHWITSSLIRFRLKSNKKSEQVNSFSTSGNRLICLALFFMLEIMQRKVEQHK